MLGITYESWGEHKNIEEGGQQQWGLFKDCLKKT
jgi:hypothetical protein